MQSTFKWFDYLLFVFMLLLSTLIGIYYGFIKKQKTASDYLLGGRQMSVFPMATSLVTSSLSGMILLSFPADIYRYGITFCFGIPLQILILITTYYVFLPVFYKLEVTSIYEYLEERFNNRLRVFASILYTIHQVFSIPIVIYVPSLALSQVTGLSVHYITPVVCSVCIFYTTLGGMKGIVWTDAIQFGTMFVTLSLVPLVGIWSYGGLSSVLEKVYEGGRLDVSFDLSITKRDTFWSGLVIYFLNLNHYACNQSFVQKCLSLPSYKSIKSALILTAIGTILVQTLCVLCGFTIFALYSECDPLKTGIIKNYDQVMPMYVMENLNFIPGFPGLFLAGIFSASLSTLAAGINSLAATLYDDFISPFVSKKTSPERVGIYLKLLVVIIGITSTASVYIVEKLGSLLALTLSLSSVTGGPLLGIFSAGMLIPKINSKGALCGGITSLITMAWIILRSHWYKYKGLTRYPILSVSTEGCNQTVLDSINRTLSNTVVGTNLTDVKDPADDIATIYKISFFYYCLMGALIVVIVSAAVSIFTKKDKHINRDCISPVMHFLLPQDKDEVPHYSTVDTALELINKNQ